MDDSVQAKRSAGVTWQPYESLIPAAKHIQSKIERLFRRIKRFRRVFTRYEKLDVMFLAFLTFVLIIDMIK